jgi:protein-S-isoprenylcysteine O-methyltransferase Ste14
MIPLESPSALVEFTRIYLAIFYTGVALFYTVRILMTKKSINTELVFPGERFCSHWWNHMTFRLFRVSIWMVCVIRLLYPEFDQYLGLITTFDNVLVPIFGNVLLTIGFLMTIIIHFSMKQQWRSGVDPKGPNTLITNGFFKYSRNPIFVSVGLSQLGFFLALPSIFTLVCLIIGLYTLYKQTMVEEQHLVTIFQDDYKSYQSNVRRWV